MPELTHSQLSHTSSGKTNTRGEKENGARITQDNSSTSSYNTPLMPELTHYHQERARLVSHKILQFTTHAMPERTIPALPHPRHCEIAEGKNKIRLAQHRISQGPTYSCKYKLYSLSPTMGLESHKTVIYSSYARTHSLSPRARAARIT